MFLTFNLLLCLPSIVLSATVQRPQPSAFEAAPGLSSLTQTNDSSTSPVSSDSSVVIETLGEGPIAKTNLLLPGFNSSEPEYASFEYPDLDVGPLGATDANVECRGGSLGENLTRYSCNDALNRMSIENTRLNFGQRFTQQWHVKLPFRTSSLDSFCVIDVTHARGKVSDVATPFEIKNAAEKVVKGCVKNGAPNTGGLIRNVGKVDFFPGLSCS